MKHIQIEDAKIACYDSGKNESGASILFAHGFPLDHTMWNPQIDHLQRTFRCIAPDLRGFGKSETPPVHTITMQRMADDCAAILDALEIDQPVIFCGLSMGGYVAWEFFRRHRARLAKLILCDTRAAGDDPETARGRRVMAEHVTNQGLTALGESMLPKLLAKNAKEELSDELKANILDNDPRHVAAVMRGLAARNSATELLEKIDAPTLVICGSEDSISTATEMRGFAGQIPNAKFVLVEGVGHMATMEEPSEVNKAIVDFCE